MGSILQERVTPRCVERVPASDREWKKVSWSSSRPNVSSNKMGRRQSQRKSPQAQNPDQNQDQNQENHREKRPQRRKNKSINPSSKCSSSSPAARLQGPPASQPQSGGCREDKHGGMRGTKHTAVPSFSHPTEPDVLLEDSDTDLSDSERLPPPPCSRVPPQLQLRPEAMEADVSSSGQHRSRQAQGGFDFPDFLPPPFNAWSLSQLAVFYNAEGRAAPRPRPRPAGPLERYLERLLQLELRQIQTVQEESGRPAGSEVVSGCRSASSRLSSPKCILQCQRAFPLSFLSSLAGHSVSCSASCCRSGHGFIRPSRLSPTLERSRRAAPLPRRSYSESRVLPGEAGGSGANSYLRRMQASGNIRHPVHGAAGRTHSSVRDSGGRAGKEGGMGALRRRSGSEQRRGGAERQQNGSESRRGRCERREVKPDAVAAIMDNLPGSKSAPTRRPNRNKQVEFVT